jgi:branched-chain amino acid transport system substrate-binding protein
MTFRKLVITFALFLCSIVIFSCAQRKAPSSPPTLAPPGEKLFQRAEMKFQSKEYKAAIQLYQDYINIFPESPLVPSIFMKIGTIYLVQNQYAEARKTYQKMIETVPENQYITDAMFGILTTYYHEGDYNEVLSQAEKMDDQSIPKEIYVRKHAMLGDAYHATGLIFKSVESYIKVYVATENEEERIKILVKLEKSASDLTAEEIQNLSPLIEDLNLKGYFEYLLGLKYAQNKQYDDAVRQLTHFTTTYPEHRYVEEAHRFMETMTKRSEYEQNAVGCLLPLSGRYETFGAKALKGIELALMQYSSVNPKIDIRLIIRDTEGNPDTTEAIVNELADQKVAALIGPIINATEAAKQAQSLQIPIITMTQKEGVADIGDYVFRNFLTPEMQMKTMVSFAIEHLGLKKFAILYPNEKYGTTFMNLFWDHVIAHGGEISGVEPYEPDQTDFTIPIKKLTGRYHNGPDEQSDKPIMDFDAIFIPDGPEKSGLILPQLAYYDVTNVYLLGTNLWHSDKLIQMAQQHAQGAIMPEIFFAESSNETVVKFVHNFTETYGEQPGFIEAIAYDTALMVFQSLGSQDLQSRESIKNKLLNISDFQGVTGKTSFNPNGEANKELFILQINGDKFSELAYE